ncbi:dTDP-4-dehydrorhamnose reductase [Granulosicoccus sp. 3-233]|uniref:dTDP-4-dehydrorhamnose reductase n=1 Tax=Granulosicoccus sp. 3-233 TaxID=3417969 RepID=UPI003D33B996
MKAFITGSSRGQLHWELLRTVPEDVELLELGERLDIGDDAAVQSAISMLKPDVIINAAAYTAVDKAESEPEQAMAINAGAVESLARASIANDAHLLHVSTDFVFGQGNGAPFVEDAEVAPVSVYGKTKLAGEQVLRRLMPDSSLCMRTAWVYSSHGNNFVKTMLRLMNERGEVGVIADQVGSPTWARALAAALWHAAARRSSGTMHWTGAGVAGWYDFAVAIHEEARALGLIDRPVTVKPLTTEQYPTPAARPHYSVLELTRTWQALDLRAEHWRNDLRTMLKELT